MNAAPYSHLIWKEYRAIRGFWIALIALAVFMQLLVLAFSQDRGWATEFVYNIALATPVFFAIGCIGTAYAIEKEDGTFEWLRSSPASDAQLFISKVGLCLVATVAMFAILWLVTQTLFVAPPNQADVLRGMLGLWLLAGLEALAWGLLFSLLSARPLMAIVLALFATSTAIHVLSWIVQPAHPDQFEYSRYVAAIPLRLGLLAAVATADVFLGFRWLGSEERTSLLSPREKEDASARRPATKADITTLLSRRDRATIFGRLTWQTFRQSGRLMLTLAVLQVTTCLLAANSGLNQGRYSPIVFIPLVAVAALMGANVFQADQQRGNFRYFVEHNVPPRYVWFTRLAAWTAVAICSTAVSVIVRLGLEPLGQLISLALNLRYGLINPYSASASVTDWRDYSDLFASVSIILASLAVVPAFAAGQWISMMVRSGLLAGFFSLLLAAGVVLWCSTVVAANLSWLLFLLPIPLIFLAATWLRAPDWILENTTWKARLRAAGAVFIPAAVMLVAAPIARISQVPDVAPGFDPAVYVADITPAALKTGELYRRANEVYGSASPPYEEYFNLRRVKTWASNRVATNQESLNLILKASQRDASALANPATLTNWPILSTERLVSLVAASAYDLEWNGQAETALADSLDRHFTTFTVERQLNSFAPRIDVTSIPRLPMDTLALLTDWAAHSGQTRESLRDAAARLEQLDSSLLKWDDALKSNLILCQRLVAGDPNVASVLYPGKKSAAHISRVMFQLRLMPWERERERRALNLSTQQGLHLLATIRLRMEHGEDVGESAFRAYRYSAPEYFFDGHLSSRMRAWTHDAVMSEIMFETARRATLLTLAAQAYRLEHGELPKTLEPLREHGILGSIPNDPMTGRPFIYFPEGIPQPRTERERRALKEYTRHRSNWNLASVPFKPEIPCFWSPGVSLETRVDTSKDEDGQEYVEVSYMPRYLLEEAGGYARSLPDYEAWLQGEWFPIPAKK